MSYSSDTQFQVNNILEWKNVDVEVKNLDKNSDEKRIKLISDACGKMESGILAIMGPIGSGKTTLLRALAGHVPKNCSTTGEVLLNGHLRNINDWMRNIGFADQDTIFFENLTVSEVLELAAKFRRKEENKNLTIRIETLLMDLSITHISDRKMKFVSEVEKRRVLIAAEIICDPKILFLDEPTTELDSNSSGKMINYLKTLSEQGRMIILTVRQPSQILLGKFDKLLLLSQGRTVFFGCTQKCEQYLVENGFNRIGYESFSDFALRILDTERGSHGTENIAILDKMAKDIEYLYGSNHENKQITTTDHIYVQNAINLDHMGLLFLRKIKTRMLFKGKNLQMLIMTLLGVIVCNLWSLYFCPRLKSFSAWEKAMIEVVEDQMGVAMQYFRIYNQKYLSITIIFIFSHISLTMLSTCAFYEEMNIIRVEIAKGAYSHFSYLLATLLFEICCSSIFLPFVWASVYFLADVIDVFTLLSLSLIYYIACIMFSLMFSTLLNYFTTLKNGQIASLFNVLIQFAVLCASWFIYSLYSTSRSKLPFYLMNFICPTYTTHFMLRLLLMNAVIADYQNRKIAVPMLLPIRYLCVLVINPRVAFVFFLISITITSFITSLSLKKTICPRIRLRLNLQ